MRPNHFILAAIALCVTGVLSVSGWSQPARPVTRPNPFAAPSTLPLQAPMFDKIKDSDYAPGFDDGMKQQRAEMDAIAAQSAAPTFDNTIAAMEKSGRMLDRV